jgi:hypothetical protein
MEPELRSVDYYNFHAYEGPGGGGITYEYSYVFHGPGPRYLLNQGTQDIYLGGTLLTLLRINSISPERALIGRSVELVINGSGFKESGGLDPELSIEGEGQGMGLEVTAFSATDTQIRVTLLIRDSASAGNHAVKVITDSGEQSNTVNFFVQIPTALVRQNFPPEYTPPQESTGIGPLIPLIDGSIINLAGESIATHRCGAYRNLLYQLVDQAGQPIIATVSVTETFPSAGYTGPSTLKPVDKPIASNNAGYVGDTNGFSTPANQCLTTNPNIVATQNFFATIGTKPYNLTTVVRITFTYDPASHTYAIGNTIITP